MDIDARTKETAVTLLGVGYRGPRDAESVGIRSSWEGIKSNEVPGPGSQHGMTSSVPLASEYPHSNSLPYHMQQQAAHNGSVPHHSHSVSAGNHAPSDTGTVLSMSSIGFGIDSSSSAAWGDATEAAVRALQDAMERSTLRLPMAMSAQHLLQIKVQLGVPPKQPNSSEPMMVDVTRLTAILPRAIPVLPIQVVIGGLLVRGDTPVSPSICTSVACITLQSQAPLSIPEAPAQRVHHTVPPPIAHPSPWASLDSHQSPISSSTAPPTPVEPHEPFAKAGSSIPAEEETKTTSNGHEASKPIATPKVHRTNSIEMLAMISEEIRLAADKNRNAGSNVQNEVVNAPFGQATAALSAELYDNDSDEAQMRNGNYNYKKLPPGVTTKNNRRLFVKHTYRDHSGEKPLVEEQDLVGSSSTSAARTPNAAFPLKLHETLSQIENNGHGDIIGWMPHGRSFKIHKQKEFAEIILPRYFVMTKKSSFLRQLNLYGFNRFSAGPDQGSYYHEKFLRGMKFLCRRMTRQKVNGNRIRSAGNPDEEPVLSAYPSCPPSATTSGNPTISSLPLQDRYSHDSRDEDNSQDQSAEGDDADDTEDEQSIQASGSLYHNGAFS